MASAYHPPWSDMFPGNSHALPRLPTRQATPNKVERTTPLCPIITHPSALVLKLSAFTLMSHTQSTAASSSSSNSQVIINNALDTYRKRTKNDPLTHPLAARLQACDTPAAILTVLREQIDGLDQSQRNAERWSKWLDPTVNVLFAFSATIGAGIGLVCLRDLYSSEVCVLIFIW
jgi:hypothetical protein